MDFIICFLHTRWQHDSIWVIVDRMKKLDHFIPFKVSYSTEEYVKLYVKENVRLYVVPLSVISDRGPYQILRHIGKVAYELDLPNDLASVHLVFHVFLLKK
ncbi:hypothetical protein MTR67_031836 [Solanum verrucosum]|uniref:Tf2-1-like SH3-like domain-containing protein n=1 Tax=Solanum verrucosum TaxID=315347 RepID=A0AAF0U394_SOLVR|nr:hypothetical protein MTR67_031836 [Solanum verrucosum]